MTNLTLNFDFYIIIHIKIIKKYKKNYNTQGNIILKKRCLNQVKNKDKILRRKDKNLLKMYEKIIDNKNFQKEETFYQQQLIHH